MQLKPNSGRVVVSIDSEAKNSHQFESGLKIRLERDWENLNRREVAPVNAIVIASDYLPVGAEVIIHHNANHDTNRLFNYKQIGGDIDPNVKYYSIHEHDCYLYMPVDGTEWLPCKNFATALRCYIPYTGFLEGIKPTRLKGRLLITSGDLKDKVCIVLNGSDYQMVFQGINGRENNVIRIRHFEEEGIFEREEVIAIDDYYTEKYNNGELLVGLDATHCEPKESLSKIF